MVDQKHRGRASSATMVAKFRTGFKKVFDMFFDEADLQGMTWTSVMENTALRTQAEEEPDVEEDAVVDDIPPGVDIEMKAPLEAATTEA